MNIINLTPHEINIYGHETVPQWTYPPSGKVARVSQTSEELPAIAGIPVSRLTFGAVENLPEPTPNTIYIVSGLVLSRCTGRNDVFAPGEAVRDGQGRVIGCIGLSAAPEAQPWTDEQLKILLETEREATESYGYGGHISAIVSGALKPETALDTKVLDWVERHTPVILNLPEYPGYVQVEQIRNRFRQDLAINITVRDGLGDYRDTSVVIRNGDDIADKRAAVIGTIEEMMRVVED